MIEALRPSAPEPPGQAAPAKQSATSLSVFQGDVLVKSLVQNCQDQNWKSLSEMFDRNMERHHRMLQDLQRFLQTIVPLKLAEKAYLERFNRR